MTLTYFQGHRGQNLYFLILAIPHKLPARYQRNLAGTFLRACLCGREDDVLPYVGRKITCYDTWAGRLHVTTPGQEDYMLHHV